MKSQILQKKGKSFIYFFEQGTPQLILHWVLHITYGFLTHCEVFHNCIACWQQSVHLPLVFSWLGIQLQKSHFRVWFPGQHLGVVWDLVFKGKISEVEMCLWVYSCMISRMSVRLREAGHQREKVHCNAIAPEAANGTGSSRSEMALQSYSNWGKGPGLFYRHSDQALDVGCTQERGYSPSAEDTSRRSA